MYSMYNVVGQREREKSCVCTVCMYCTFSRMEHWSSKGTEAWSACTLVLAGAPILTHSSTKWLVDKETIKQISLIKKVMQCKKKQPASFSTSSSVLLSSVSESIVHGSARIGVASYLQLVGRAVLEGEERLDPAAAAVADDHDDLHLERAHGVLDGRPDAGVLGLQQSIDKSDESQSAISVYQPTYESCRTGPQEACVLTLS